MEDNKLLALGVGFLTILMIILIVALPFMWLWNWLMPLIFGLTKITFWQSLGILLLSHMLFPINSSGKS